MTIHRHIPDGVRYASISEPVLNDQRISWFDKCVLCSLLLKTQNWKVMATHMAKELGVNEKTIRRSLLALEAATYVEPIYTEVNGKRWRSDSVVMATPRTFEAQTKQHPRTFEAQTPGQMKPRPLDISVRTPGQKCPATESVSTESRVTESRVTEAVQPSSSSNDIKFTDAQLKEQAEYRAAVAKAIPNQFSIKVAATTKVGSRIRDGWLLTDSGAVMRRANAGDIAAFGASA